jgi:glycosyltransferase involved in cell wall biosynthesis
MGAKRKPDLTIVIPTFNRKHLLKQCLDSILLTRDFCAEIFVIDDCSTDETVQMLQKLAATETFHFLRWQVNEINRGPQYGRNLGVQTASTDYIHFVDSDDLVLVEGVANALAGLRDDPSLEFVTGRVLQVDDNLVDLCLPPVGRPFERNPQSLASYDWHTMGAIYRREFILNAVGPWNTRLSGSQDWEFQARVKLAATTYAFFDMDLGLWRQHSGERVGVRSFSLKYTRSVGLATRLVFDAAKRAKRLDAALRRRLARKLFLHALQLGAFGHRRDKQYFLALVLQIAPLGLEAAAARVFWAGPSSLDHILLKRMFPHMLR